MARLTTVNYSLIEYDHFSSFRLQTFTLEMHVIISNAWDWLPWCELNKSIIFKHFKCIYNSEWLCFVFVHHSFFIWRSSMSSFDAFDDPRCGLTHNDNCVLVYRGVTESIKYEHIRIMKIKFKSPRHSGLQWTILLINDHNRNNNFNMYVDIIFLKNFTIPIPLYTYLVVQFIFLSIDCVIFIVIITNMRAGKMHKCKSHLYSTPNSSTVYRIIIIYYRKNANGVFNGGWAILMCFSVIYIQDWYSFDNNWSVPWCQIFL